MTRMATTGREWEEWEEMERKGEKRVDEKLAPCWPWPLNSVLGPCIRTPSCNCKSLATGLLRKVGPIGLSANPSSFISGGPRHELGGLAPQSTCRLARPHRETHLTRIGVRNFQILIVSAVKICEQRLQTASASVKFRPPDSLGYSSPNENSWRRDCLWSKATCLDRLHTRRGSFVALLLFLPF